MQSYLETLPLDISRHVLARRLTTIADLTALCAANPKICRGNEWYQIVWFTLYSTEPPRIDRYDTRSINQFDYDLACQQADYWINQNISNIIKRGYDQQLSRLSGWYHVTPGLFAASLAHNNLNHISRVYSMRADPADENFLYSIAKLSPVGLNFLYQTYGDSADIVDHWLKMFAALIYDDVTAYQELTMPASSLHIGENDALNIYKYELAKGSTADRMIDVPIRAFANGSRRLIDYFFTHLRENLAVDLGLIDWVDVEMKLNILNNYMTYGGKPNEIPSHKFRALIENPIGFNPEFYQRAVSVYKFELLFKMITTLIHRLVVRSNTYGTWVSLFEQVNLLFNLRNLTPITRAVGWQLLRAWPSEYSSPFVKAWIRDHISQALQNIKVTAAPINYEVVLPITATTKVARIDGLRPTTAANYGLGHSANITNITDKPIYVIHYDATGKIDSDRVGPNSMTRVEIPYKNFGTKPVTVIGDNWYNDQYWPVIFYF